MATAEQALYALLTSGSPPLAQRVYADALPQYPVYPAVRYQRISTDRSGYRTLDGRASYARPRFQLDIYDLSRSGACNLAQQIYLALEGWRGVSAGLMLDAIATEDERAALEEGAASGGGNIYTQSIDLFLFHPEA